MQPLSNTDILRVWEAGLHRHPQERALIILAFACPDASYDELASMTIGTRDSMLVELFETTFGSILQGLSVCPGCRADLEFEVSTQHIKNLPGAAGKMEPGAFKLFYEGMEVDFRLPDGRDLVAASGFSQAREARELLLERCILRAHRDGTQIAIRNLPAETVELLAGRMAEAEPAGDLQLNLECQTCRHNWLLTLDISLFLWAKIRALAERTMRDIHALARAYGWREQDILAMSPVRRQFYLEMVP
jgi:hypothetical protein